MNEIWRRRTEYFRRNFSRRDPTRGGSFVEVVVEMGIPNGGKLGRILHSVAGPRKTTTRADRIGRSCLTSNPRHARRMFEGQIDRRVEVRFRSNLQKRSDPEVKRSVGRKEPDTGRIQPLSIICLEYLSHRRTGLEGDTSFLVHQSPQEAPSIIPHRTTAEM